MIEGQRVLGSPASRTVDAEFFGNVVSVASVMEANNAISDTIAGIVTPADLLKYGKLQVYLHNYEWIKIHSMSIDWLSSYVTWIVSMYDPALSSFGTTQKLESFYERQPSLRTHRSDRNGKGGVLSKTENLGMKQCFKDYGEN